MKKPNIKPNLAGILLIVFGIIVIALAILFFTADPKKNQVVSSELIKVKY